MVKDATTTKPYGFVSWNLFIPAVILFIYSDSSGLNQLHILLIHSL